MSMSSVMRNALLLRDSVIKGRGPKLQSIFAALLSSSARAFSLGFSVSFAPEALALE